MSEHFERRVEVAPGYCLLHDDPTQNYGVAACRIWFYLIGSQGAVQFMIGTDWYPKDALLHLAKFPKRDEPQPQAWDIGYHARVPQYEDQRSMGHCDLLGCDCFYDGSSLSAEDWVEGFICGGTAWLWPKLEEYYRCRFEGGEYPDLTPVPKARPVRAIASAEAAP